MIISERKRNKIELLVRTCRLIARMHRSNPKSRKSEVKYYELLVNYYSRLLHAKEEGKFIAAHTVFFPVEILYAMDIVPMHTEMTTWTMALMLSEQAELLEAGDGLGLAWEICSPHRGLAGAFALGAVPRPDVMLWSNLICDNTAKSGELIMELNGCPGFYLDHPFENSPAEVKYLVGELEELIRFLEEKSGRKMNWDRLSEIIAEVDQQIELSRQINKLRQALPSPLNFLGFLELLTADFLMPGHPEGTEYLEAVYQELAGMVHQDKGAVAEERFRLMTLFIPPMYLMGFLDKFFRECGAVSVVEPLFTLWPEGRLNPAKPLESLVKKLSMFPERRTMYGVLGKRTLQELIDGAQRYKVDGAIYWAFMGCRQSCATIKLFKDALDKIEVPMLTLDCDILDPTLNSKEEVREKLERFFELLEGRSRHLRTVGSVSVKAIGIDIGSLTTKAVVLDGEHVLASSTILSSDSAESSAQAAMTETLRKATRHLDEDWRIVATGTGVALTSFRQQKPITACLARGIHYLFPSVRMVLDIGAESSTVVKLDEQGGVRDWATQDKCAAGTGIFLQQIARLMQMPLEEMAKLSLQAKGKADISTTCAVFAESEVISHVHREPPTPREDIVAGIYASVVSRIISLCKRIGVEKEVAVVGGVARNSGLVKILEEELGFEVRLPDMPQTVAALGAALLAQEDGDLGSE